MKSYWLVDALYNTRTHKHTHTSSYICCTFTIDLACMHFLLYLTANCWWHNARNVKLVYAKIKCRCNWNGNHSTFRSSFSEFGRFQSTFINFSHCLCSLLKPLTHWPMRISFDDTEKKLHFFNKRFYFFTAKKIYSIFKLKTTLTFLCSQSIHHRMCFISYALCHFVIASIIFACMFVHIIFFSLLHITFFVPPFHCIINDLRKMVSSYIMWTFLCRKNALILKTCQLR